MRIHTRACQKCAVKTVRCAQVDLTYGRERLSNFIYRILGTLISCMNDELLLLYKTLIYKFFVII